MIEGSEEDGNPWIISNSSLRSSVNHSLDSVEGVCMLIDGSYHMELVSTWCGLW